MVFHSFGANIGYSTSTSMCSFDGQNCISFHCVALRDRMRSRPVQLCPRNGSGIDLKSVPWTGPATATVLEPTGPIHNTEDGVSYGGTSHGIHTYMDPIVSRVRDVYTTPTVRPHSVS
jgi:hypothetical protein